MYKHRFEIALGDEVEELITGLKGKITTQIQHITGCDRYSVQPEGKDKEKEGTRDTITFDVTRLKVKKPVKVKFTSDTADFKFNNGDEVKDTITGITGVVVYRYRLIDAPTSNKYGVVQKGLTEKGKEYETENFGEDRLNLVKAAVVKPMYTEEETTTETKNTSKPRKGPGKDPQISSRDM